jgi:hypothetical protein
MRNNGRIKGEQSYLSETPSMIAIEIHPIILEIDPIDDYSKH